MAENSTEAVQVVQALSKALEGRARRLAKAEHESEVTDEHIAKLRDEAGEHGDTEQHKLASAALRGDKAARAKCVAAITSARAAQGSKLKKADDEVLLEPKQWTTMLASELQKSVADYTAKLEELRAKELKKSVYVTCPECESNFRTDSHDSPLPNHRGLDRSGVCEGAGKSHGDHWLNHADKEAAQKKGLKKADKVPGAVSGDPAVKPVKPVDSKPKGGKLAGLLKGEPLCKCGKGLHLGKCGEVSGPAKGKMEKAGDLKKEGVAA